MQVCKRAHLSKVEKNLKTPEPRLEAFSIIKSLPSSEKATLVVYFDHQMGTARHVGYSKYDFGHFFFFLQHHDAKR